MFKVIVIATDGSQAGDLAISFAKNLAVEQKSRLLVVHVDELVPGRGGAHHIQVLEPEMKQRSGARSRGYRQKDLMRSSSYTKWRSAARRTRSQTLPLPPEPTLSFWAVSEAGR